MQHTLPFATLAAMLCTLAWASITQPLPPDNPIALKSCMQHHPERYCRLTHAPSTVTDKQR